MKKEHPKFEGILLFDKPQGMTSHDVVDCVRRKLQMKKVGHAGTLDPNATGLLVILVGRATKVSHYLMSVDKQYEGRMELGVATDSYDSEGEVMATQPVPDLSEEAVRSIFSEFTGDQYQIPPMFSAKKVGGVPLYKMARKGKEIEREPRFIHVHEFKLMALNLPLIDFYVACGKGTYIRALAHDIGKKLGCGAHLAGLRRTASGSFGVEDATGLEDFDAMSISEVQRRLIPVYRAVPSHVL